MAGKLTKRGPQLLGRVPRPGDPRSKRNPAAAAAAYLQDGFGLKRDSQGKLELNFDVIATNEQVSDLQARIETLEAAIKAAGTVT